MAVVFNSALEQPFAQWEEVDVTFPSTPNTDTIVRHTLVPQSPEAINYIPIRKAQASHVYHDASGTRKPWQKGYIVVRSDIANAKVTLLLYVSHATRRTLAF